MFAIDFSVEPEANSVSHDAVGLLNFKQTTTDMLDLHITQKKTNPGLYILNFY